MAQSFAEEPGVRFRVKAGEFSETQRGFLTCVGLVALRAGGIVLQNADGLRHISRLNQMGDIRLDVFWRDTPSVTGQKNGLLAAVRNRSPKLAVENLPMGLDHNSSVGHLVFVSAKYLTEIFDLLVHAVEHLAHGIDSHFAALKSLESKLDRQMFGQFHEDGFVRLACRRLGCETSDGSPQILLGAARQFSHLFLEYSGSSRSSLPSSNVSETRQGAQYRVYVVLGGSSCAAAAMPGTASATDAAPNSQASANSGACPAHWPRRMTCRGN